MWFESLTGFKEESPDQVRANLILEGDRMVSRANGQSYRFGHLEIPSLGELRKRVQGLNMEPGQLTIKEVIGNVQDWHIMPAHAGAFFQSASQFNLLEMVSPDVTPEEGIDRYERDYTQGPACAIACGAGTIYRNYFVELDGQRGQTYDKQIDCLGDIGRSLGNEGGSLWKMVNGYALASKEGLQHITARILGMDEEGRDGLRKQLQIGMQWDTQVTLQGSNHSLSQAYCSALPVAYSQHSDTLWEAFARLILEASYEASLAAAALNARKTQNPKVFLTLLGGGAFGNRDAWITDALLRALRLYAQVPLEVSIVSYGQSNPVVQNIISAYRE